MFLKKRSTNHSAMASQPQSPFFNPAPRMSEENATIQRTEEPQATGSRDDLWFWEKGCFRYRSGGVYQTLRKMEAPGLLWQFIHTGECTACENQLYFQCCEPGDQECE